MLTATCLSDMRACVLLAQPKRGIVMSSSRHDVEYLGDVRRMRMEQVVSAVTAAIEEGEQDVSRAPEPNVLVACCMCSVGRLACAT